jgi:hypothetical protein
MPIKATSAANDHRLPEDMVDGITPVRQPVGWPRKRSVKLHGDKGYDYPICRKTLARRRIKARIARKGIESATAVLVPSATGRLPGRSGTILALHGHRRRAVQERPSTQPLWTRSPTGTWRAWAMECSARAVGEVRPASIYDNMRRDTPLAAIRSSNVMPAACRALATACPSAAWSNSGGGS